MRRFAGIALVFIALPLLTGFSFFQQPPEDVVDEFIEKNAKNFKYEFSLEKKEWGDSYTVKNGAGRSMSIYPVRLTYIVDYGRPINRNEVSDAESSSPEEKEKRFIKIINDIGKKPTEKAETYAVVWLFFKNSFGEWQMRREQ